MQGIEDNRTSLQGVALLREAITAAAAIGFLAGGGSRMVTGLGDMQHVCTSALDLSLGAIVAAVLAGVVVNLIGLPALSWALPGRRLPADAYRAAAALVSIAAFVGAFVRFAPVAV